MNIGKDFVSRCKAIVRARYGSVNAFCAYAERTEGAGITKWQIINTLNSSNPRIVQMQQIADLLESDLRSLIFENEISLKVKGVDDGHQ